MSTSVSSVPALVAAFVFGIVVNSAFAALLLHVSSHGGSVFRDGQRLVLTTFLSSAALWALSDFISIAIDTTAASSCQVGVIFSTLFDQFARFSIEQFLLWAINKGAKTGPRQMIIQGLVGVRFILGAVFVGFSRSQFTPVCVPQSSMLPIAAIVVALDAVLIVVLAVTSFTNGLFSEARSGQSGSGRGKAVLLVVVAFAIWTATSIAMLLGMTGTTLLLRTLLPAVGLLILVVIVTVFNEVLTAEPTHSRQDLPSPGIRNVATGDSTSTAMSGYPPSRFEDVKRDEAGSFQRSRNLPQPDVSALAANLSNPMVMTARVEIPRVDMNDAAFAMPISAFATTATGGATARDLTRQTSKTKRGIFDFRSAPSAGKMVISNPILEANGDMNPLNKITTISLEEAARDERDKRTNDMQRDSALIAKRPAPQPPNMSPEEALKRSVNLKRKEVAPQPPLPTPGMLEPTPMAMTSSAELSPGVESMRRRSPGQSPIDKTYRTPANRATGMTTTTISTTLSPSIQLPSPQQPMRGRLTQDQFEEMELREEMDRIDQLQQEVFAPDEPQATMAPVSASAMPARPAEPAAPVDSAVRRPFIRPSRQLPDSPKAASPEPSKTPLQRRPTIGLPSNPRARAHTLENGRQQTVLFMNNMVYSDPKVVQNIIDGGDVDAKAHNRDSMVHRPRPIPRWQEIDRAIFPAEPSPAGHRRTKSGGSVMIGRKSALLQSHPGSPTQLPPLPLPPTMMAMQAAYDMERPSANRPQPNDTKSMTFDEKMKYLFPASPSSVTDSVALRRRSSSVPEMPTVPRDFIPIALSPTQANGSNSRISTSTFKTGRTSVKTENILDVDQLLTNTRFDTECEFSVQPLRVVSSVATDQGAGRKRASSPLLPTQIWDSAMSASSDVRTHDDATTNWGSVHSPVIAVPIPANRLMARSTYINGGAGIQEGPIAPAAAAELPLLPATTYMAQPPQASEISPPASISSRSASPDKEWDEEEAENQKKSQWHRRIGDDTLSFSERKDRTRSRKMPPPTPLLLRNAHPSTNNPVIVKAAQLSPLESPEHALAYIQAQLRKYEEPNEAGSAAEETPTRRLALLENLEKEMDMQAGHWQEMQQNLRHGSMSTMQTLSPLVDSRRQSVRQSQLSISGALAQQQKSTRRSLMVSGTLGAFNYTASRSDVAQQQFPNSLSEIGDLGSPTPPDSDNEEADLDLRLHRGQSEHKDLASVDISAFQPAKKLPSLLWSPKHEHTTTMTALLWTPASAASSQQSLFASVAQPSFKLSKGVKKSLASGPLPIKSVSLWSKDANQLSVQKDAGRGLWMVVRSHDQSHAIEAEQSYESDESDASEQVDESEESSFVKSQMQKMQDLEMEMSAMEADQQRMSTSSQKAPRPLTQRPPRRSKRVTMLPDILESPKPLPDKRGTLGIFQFPWGERSDTAKVPLRGVPFAMPGTMASGGGRINESLDARAKQLEMDEYSSSFFDDYDDDDEEDENDEDYNSSNGLEEEEQDNEGSDSDEAFDENTLWEIASLLKSEQVPSKLSLLPPPHPTPSDSALGDYVADMALDNEIDQFERSIADDNGVIMGLSLNNAIMQQEEEKSIETQLWRDEKKSHQKSASVGEPDEATWSMYNTVSQAATLRPKPRKASEPAQVETSQLWDQSTVATAKKQSITSLPANPHSSLWAAKAVQSEKQITKAESKMWTPRSAVSAAAASSAKLFDLEAATAAKLAFAVTRTTDQEPAALLMARVPRALKTAPLQKLLSTSLWSSATKKAVKSQMWAPRKVVEVKAVTMLFDKDAAIAAKMASALTRTTDLEPAALNMTRKVRAVKAEPLATLKSTSLWTPAKRSGSGMWAPRPAIKITARLTGLFDKEFAAAAKLASALTRTTHLEPAALNMPRKVRVLKAAPLDKLQSTSLWAATKISKPSMWASRPVVKVAAYKAGLFDKHAAAAAKIAFAVTRTTDLAPAALHMTRKVRVNKAAPLDKLESVSLWAPVKRTATRGMWAPRPAAKVTVQAGLFDKHAAAAAKIAFAVTRTTDLAPAALHMTRKARAPTFAPLEKLQSANLWTPVKRTVARGMWAPRAAVKTTVRKTELFNKEAAAAAKMATFVTRTTDLEPIVLKMPRASRTPKAMPLEKLMSTSLWAAKSVSGSGMWTPMPAPKVQAKGYLFDRDVAAAEKMQQPIRTTAAEPAAIAIDRAPRSFSHLPELQLESAAMWAVPTTNAMKRMSFNWIVAEDSQSIPIIQDLTFSATNVGVKQMTWWEKMKAASGLSVAVAAPEPSVADIEAEIDSVRMALPSTPVMLRPTANTRDWMNALNEAVAASYPVVYRPRTNASSSEWQLAMESAVARSYPFDSARKHPAMASASVATSPTSNDASKLHPVFFQPAKAVEKIQLVSTASAAKSAFQARIASMESQALKGASRGVVLRY